MIAHLILFFSAVIVSAVVTYPIVWLLKFYHLSQFIRQEGPASHKKKAGTPTMGGIGFVLTIIAFTIVLFDFDLDLNYLALLLLVFGFGLIGFADDFLKILRKQNQGLTFWQKIVFQFILAGLFSYFLIRTGHHQTVGQTLTFLGFSIPTLYFLLSTFVIIGGANAANLTDGLNGLLAGCAVIAFLFFSILAANQGLPEAATFCVFSAGAIAAFLFYNFPSAHVFMGDVGSLSIGAALAGIALIIHQEIALAVIGGIFVIEALSVIIQVSFYKLFKRRVFKMAPLHHHFELLGYKETVIVIGFWVVAVFLGIAGILVKPG